MNIKNRRLVELLTLAFTNLYDPGYWIFDVVAPERTLKKDLFATLMFAGAGIETARQAVASAFNQGNGVQIIIV
ncbi:MAG: hypothetical protein ACXV8Q_10020 [Methylobacter sp.]